MPSGIFELPVPADRTVGRDVGARADLADRESDITRDRCGVALLIGFRSAAGVLDWLAVAAILILFTLALTWIAVIPGLTASSVADASAFSYSLIFLPFLNSAFVPTDAMPGPVRWFAEHQPVASIVNPIRDLFAGQPGGSDLWVALACCVGILIVAYVFAMVIYRRKIN